MLGLSATLGASDKKKEAMCSEFHALSSVSTAKAYEA
jgi:hypothetical protein